jgi:hypothetical protein
MREKRPNNGYCGCAQGQPAVGQAPGPERPRRPRHRGRRRRGRAQEVHGRRAARRVVGAHRERRPVAVDALRVPPARPSAPVGVPGPALAKVTPKVADDLYGFLSRETGRKPAAVLRFHSVLRAAFAQAVRWGWLDRNPERATPPRVHSVETVPPLVVDVLRVLDRAAASRNPENAIVSSHHRRHRLPAGRGPRPEVVRRRPRNTRRLRGLTPARLNSRMRGAASHLLRPRRAGPGESPQSYDRSTTSAKGMNQSRGWRLAKR